MKLIELSANQDSFKTVRFNENGISFIVAKQKNLKENDTAKTYNGVGKSLVVLLIHFCLGAKAKDYKSFIEKLPSWEFFLTIKINETQHVIKRSMAEPTKIYFDNEPAMTVTNFNKKIVKMVFQFPEDIQYLTFRNIIPFFIRQLKKSYVDALEPSYFHGDYAKCIANSFLMGLDASLVQNKYKLRERQTQIENFKKNIKNDDLLKDFFTKDKDVHLKIKDLEDEIKKLQNDREKYEVADDYYDIKIEADKIKSELEKKHNEIVLLKSQIDNISKSLRISPDLEKTMISKIYEEAKINFSDNVIKKLDDLDNFYIQLKENRIQRLSDHKQSTASKLEECIKNENHLKKELDNKFKYLGAHQALDVMMKVGDRLKDLEKEKEKLESSGKLMEDFYSQSLEIKDNLIKSTQRTEEYLKETSSLIDEKQEFFRVLAKRFYPNSSSGITIYNDDGENQTRFKIEAKIESDDSDGINNVKIFCYDMTILFKGYGHSVKFNFHDSRLFDGIDERHKTEMIKVVDDLFSNSEYQYIATVNQNQLNEMKSILGSDEYEKIVSENTILTLTDESDSEKLLGIKVDIGYKN